MKELDNRLNAVRTDLADSRLKGRVAADAFTDGTPMQVSGAVVAMRRDPADDAGCDTELLFGERVRVFENKNGWAWCQCDTDSYVGYVRSDQLDPQVTSPTHRVGVPRTFLYPEAELRRSPLMTLSMGSPVRIVGSRRVRDLDYAMLSDGSAIVARHLTPLTNPLGDDYVAIAELFAETPYLWAGRSSIGIDCSALIQIAMMMTGDCPLRDTYMQETSIGKALDITGGLPDLRRGDLVFWQGHVGAMCDTETLLHASGYQMQVVREPLAAVVGRLDKANLPVTTVRRP